MSTKRQLSPFQIFDSADMSADLTSPATCIQYLDNVGIQLQFTGNPEGAFAVQVSLDYAQDSLGNITNSGTWIDLALSPAPVADGEADQIYVDLNQISAPWIRTSYTATPIVEEGTITTVADSSGSLNNKYFLINGADGTNWYAWFNVSSGGTDPAVPSRTGIQVTISTDATAAQVATAIDTALSASCTSLTNVVAASTVVSWEQSTSGTGSVTDSVAAPTGFAFAETVSQGVLSGYITGKAV